MITELNDKAIEVINKAIKEKAIIEIKPEHGNLIIVKRKESREVVYREEAE